MEKHTAKSGGTYSGPGLPGGKKDLTEGERRHKKRDSTSKKRPKEPSQPSGSGKQSYQLQQSRPVNPSDNKTTGPATSKEPSLLQQLINKVSLKSHNSKDNSLEAAGGEDIVEFPLKPLKDKGSSKSSKTGTKHTISKKPSNKKQLENIKDGCVTVTPQIPVLKDFSTTAASSNNLVSVQEKLLPDKKSRRISDQTPKVNQRSGENRGKSPSSIEKSRKYSSKEISYERTKIRKSPKTKSSSSKNDLQPSCQTKFSNSGAKVQPPRSRISPSFSERILLARTHLKKVKDTDAVDCTRSTQKPKPAATMNAKEKTGHCPSQETPVECLWKPKPPLIKTKVSEEDLSVLMGKHKQVSKIEAKSVSDQILADTDKQDTKKYGEELQERIQNAISSLRKVVNNRKNKISGKDFEDNREKISLKPVSKSEQIPVAKSIAKEESKIPVKDDETSRQFHSGNRQTVQQLKEVLGSLSDKKISKKVTFTESNHKIVDWTESKLWKEGSANAVSTSTSKYSNCEIDQSSLVRASLIKSIVASRALEKANQNVEVVSKQGKQNEALPNQKHVIVTSNLEPAPKNVEDSPICCLPKPHWMVSIEKISDVQPHVRNKWDKVNGQLRSKLQAVDRLPAKIN